MEEKNEHDIEAKRAEEVEELRAAEISFRIPYARVLSDEESQKEDDEEIGAAKSGRFRLC